MIQYNFFKDHQFNDINKEKKFFCILSFSLEIFETFALAGKIIKGYAVNIVKSY